MNLAVPFRLGTAKRTNDEFWAAALAACPEAVAIVQQGCVLEANPAFAGLFGTSPQKMQGRPIADFVPQSHCYARVGTQPDASIRTEDFCGYSGCRYIVNGDGRAARQVESSCREFIWRGERFLILSAHDVSQQERRRMGRDSEKRYRTIFDFAAIGIAQCTMAGRMVETNSAFERMLGYTREELHGMHFRDFTHPEDVGRDLELFQEMVAGTRDHYQMELRSLRKDKSSGWARLTTSLVRGPNGEPASVIGLVEDITERKQSEHQLREAQKMEAVGRLVGGVAHDFNNLLTAVSLYSDLLAAALEPHSRLLNHVREIRFASERGEALIQQLLATVRQHSTHAEVVSPRDLVLGMRNMLSRLIGENVRLVTNVEQHVAMIRIDPGQFQQVILNLVLNARDAMPSGGRISLECRNASAPCTFASGEATRVHDGVVLRVSDEGSGMDAETRAHLFEPFFTTKGPGHGNGLGLATVHRIVKDAGGTIQVESDVGRGTFVTIVLPVAANPEKILTHKRPRRRIKHDKGHETILLVEDDSGVRRSACRVLAELGYSVVESSNGPEALEAIQHCGAKIDLLFTDIVMPGMSGVELAERVRQSYPNLRILFMSGYDRDLTLTADEAKRIAIVKKPFTGSDLGRAIRRALDSRAKEQSSVEVSYGNR
ncbi:MAG TPA: PAS domain S-box protein [Terriglobales bacterium]|nr:PAS domain S-box protein [Terriglobales bacterium]